MIFQMPIASFLAFLIWPVIWVVLAIILFQIMKKQDDKIDDAEYTTIERGGGKK